MAEFDLKSSHEYWKNYQDPMIYRVLQIMEAVESWTQDGNKDLEAIINKFGNALETAEKFALGKEREFIELASQLKATRFLRILQAIDQKEAGSASRLLMHAEEQSVSTEDVYGLFLRRNVVFERLRLVGRIFSPERFAIIIKALEGDVGG